MTTFAGLPTPSLLVDLARVRRNCERMLAFAREGGVRLRPHVKTHKCVAIARLQHSGEIGAITVSTLAEAEHFAAAGFGDILYAVPVELGKPPCAPSSRTAALSLPSTTTTPTTARRRWHRDRG